MFVEYKYLSDYFKDKTVAVVGSAPSVINNSKGFIDKHDIVVRVNNYKIIDGTGKRTDVHYSFYGGSIRKSVTELKTDGTKLCMCKCPNSKPIESEWHEKNGKTLGIDFRKIYRRRESWWFCPVYIPSDGTFLELFNKLDRHIPTTGFSAIWEILRLPIKSMYITGFDFFTSKKHNVNERWLKGDSSDPIKHTPEAELNLLLKWRGCDNRIMLDTYLQRFKWLRNILRKMTVKTPEVLQ